MELLNNGFEELFVWDRTSIVMTVVTLLILGAGLVSVFVIEGHVWVKVLLATFVAGMIAVSVSSNPYKLRGDGNGLEVLHFVGKTAIPAESIVNVRRVGRDELRGAVRTCASGGFLGYFGKFRCKALGKFSMYGANTSSLVLVETTHGNYLLSSPTLYGRLEP